ncbi:MAG: hypothetical protein NWE88_08565 [Candidatus Bathyarchaeota archaeon]|nr:hypothetical protein [Candidatus Bathyarchaeota archaeon]
MKRERASMLILVIAIAMASQILMVEAPDYLPVLRISTDDVYVTAGEESLIKFTLTNVGSWSIYEAKISLSVPATTPGISLLDGYHKVYNRISDGASTSFYTRVYVDEDTPLGAYSLTLQATYMQKVQYGVEMLESTTLQIGIVVDSVSKLSYRMSAEADNPVFTAGADNHLNVVLGNLGDATVYEIDATVTSTSPYIVVLEGSRFTHGNLDANLSVLHPATVRVSRNTPLGVYTLSETVAYEDEAGQTYFESFIVGITVNSSTVPNPMLSVNIEDPRLIAGAENPVTVNLVNIGDEGLTDIEVSLVSASPYIAILDGGRINIDELDPDESVAMDVVIAVSRSAPVGVYTLSTSSTYQGSDGQVYMEASTLGVSVESVEVPVQTSVVMSGYGTSIDPVRPGDEFELVLELECLGSDAHDVKAALSLDPLTGISTMSPTLVSLGEMDAGERSEAQFDLLVSGNVRAGQYPGIATITYLDADGVPRSLRETVTLSVRGIVEFTLINAGPVSAGIGESKELEADMLLVGTESVQFVNIEVVEDSVFERTAESEEYIGAVDPDSPIPFEVWFRVAEGTDVGEHTLTLKITYQDDLNQEHVETLRLTVDVEEASSLSDTQASSTGGFWVWLRRLLGLG